MAIPMARHHGLPTTPRLLARPPGPRWERRALVRPLVWLFIFAAGFRNTLGTSITPPYETYVLYEAYVVPGLAVMIQLFNGMQSSLSMVYDREMGLMRLLLTAPLPRPWILFSKLLATAVLSLLRAYQISLQPVQVVQDLLRLAARRR